MSTDETISQAQFNDIKMREKEYLTDGDLRRFFPENKDPKPIIKYSDLANVKSIYDLLPTDKSFKVILIESRYNSGHWVAISRNKDKIYFFDSYSNKPDGQLRYIKSFWRKMLGQDDTYLTKLLEPSKLKGRQVVWNTNRLQSVKSGSGTCGRWVILWLLMNLQLGYSLDEFEEFIDKWKKKLGLTRDELITHFVK
tara:strand:- start:404 stop:991 length:588 start_codon:yes stop_codon:yes gene_type:complete